MRIVFPRFLPTYAFRTYRHSSAIGTAPAKLSEAIRIFIYIGRRAIKKRLYLCGKGLFKSEPCPRCVRRYAHINAPLSRHYIYLLAFSESESAILSCSWIGKQSGLFIAARATMGSVESE